MKNNNTTEYKVLVTVDGKTVPCNQYLENIQSAGDGTVSMFVRGSGIPPEFFEDEEELYSRELYFTGDLVDVDDGDDERFPSKTEPSLWFENIEDYDKETNFRKCFPVVDHEKKTMTFARSEEHTSGTPVT